MCQLARVSRASFYRSFYKQQPAEEELEVRSAIQQIAIAHRRRYGYRRIFAELRRRGMQVNHKRVMRIIAKDNLLAVQPRSFVVTTNSNHEFEVYLNLAGRMKHEFSLWTIAPPCAVPSECLSTFLIRVLQKFKGLVKGRNIDMSHFTSG